MYKKTKNELEDTVSITLQKQDAYFLHMLKDLFEYTGELHYIKRQDTWSLWIHDAKFVYWLYKNFNIKENKSLSYIPPELPPDLMKYFLLGIFDSDGCISYTENKREGKEKDKMFQINITGTLETCMCFKNYFSLKPNPVKRHKESETNNYTLYVSGRNQIYRILNELYSEDIIPYCLKRKYEKFLLLKESL